MFERNQGREKGSESPRICVQLEYVSNETVRARERREGEKEREENKEKTERERREHCYRKHSIQA